MAKKLARKKSSGEGRVEGEGEGRAEGRAEAVGSEESDCEGGASTSTSSAKRRMATVR